MLTWNRFVRMVSGGLIVINEVMELLKKQQLLRSGRGKQDLLSGREN